jgi:hypothetical protein
MYAPRGALRGRDRGGARRTGFRGVVDPQCERTSPLPETDSDVIVAPP